MSVIYSRVLAAGKLEATGDAQLFVVPTGRIYVVRDAVLSNAASLEQVLTLYMNPGTGGIWLYRRMIPSLSTVQVAGYFVLAEGHQLHLENPTGPALYHVSGYDFAVT